MRFERQVLSNNIKTLRNEHKWTQEQLGDKLNVTKQSVSQWESAKKIPEMDAIVRMSALFGVTIDELIGTSKLRNKIVHCPETIMKMNEEKMEQRFGRNHQIQILNKELHVMTDEELDEIQKAVEFIKFKKSQKK